ncbi:hypothetical protein GQ44DRAFT_621841 [Phaeosphaeriaceae sp. PMI808]|nr:hypothetical protein GQ44DRAFT_621841 [Phaeosphaeriaceae sp. PMI808]
MAEVALTIAVDCSGSTRGKVLEEEKIAIRSISNLLSRESQDRVLILPWNHGADSAISLSEMDDLFSSGGTDPTALLRDRHHRQALLNSSLWVLITDGEIDNYLVKDFALRIGDAGLHGTASIIICVGRGGHNPAACNISVGKSVFATVPDCLFLFHDIYAQNVYILQCKGRFKTLMPKSESTVVLDDNTRWEDLPKTSYEALRDFAVPRKRILMPDTVILTSGKTFNLNDIYNDTLDASLTNEILSNDDDLKTLLLTASTRGRKEDVKRWITKKKLRVADPMWAPRVDIEHRAFRNTEKVVDALRNSTIGVISVFQQELRLAHDANWNNLTVGISEEKQQAKTREEVIADATARLRLDDRLPGSPVLMGPVSPSLSGGSYQRSKAYTPADIEHKPFYPPTRPSSQKVVVPSLPSPDILFSQGFKFVKKTNYYSSITSEYLDGVCPLCERGGQVMALMLKQPDDHKPTDNYPVLQQHAKHKYPFVLGNFPDVDIVSPEIYCETCSVYLVQYGQSPKADRVLGAFPLVQTHGSAHECNLQRWSHTLMEAFGGRFHEDIVLSVFISVLYNTLDDLTSVDSGENTRVTRAIQWTCNNLLRSVMVSSDTVSIPLGETPPKNLNQAYSTSSVPLVDTIPRLMNNALHGRGPLISYPLDGFLVLILAARDVDHEDCTRESLRCVVWLRLVMLMAESHYALMNRVSREKAKSSLHNILQTQDAEIENGDQQSTLKTSPFISLSGTYLLSSDDLETFQRMGTLFSHIGNKCGPAIAVFLHYLLEYSSMCSTAVECFELIQKGEGLRKLFVGPEELSLSKAADLIARLYANDRRH